MKMISAMTNTTDTKVKKVKTPKRTQDFKAVQLKLNEDSVAPHTIYLKEHVVREHTADKPQGRTLLVVNVPPYADEKGITNAFREAGTVQSVQLCLKPSTAEVKLIKKFLPDPSITTFKAAYIVFKKVAELDKALKLTELLPMNSEDHQITTGIKKWIEEYNNTIVLPKVLKENVETFMKQFDETTKKADKKEKELEQEDDEGWVTVTKRGKVQSFARSEKVENKIMQKEEKNKKRKELKNFYTFQIRESKMKHIVSLRQKFEEDKRKIAQIKQSRRFRPF
ncbi:ribosomal RNA-processing protein 7 homolog A [Spodoptera litura]|uniref:Ribosomal RNA-processing protein 7 homolog A n=1 Tax=Spodoptera litura TaxID=69820 RepID=A0A9J7EG71_SPOLT|nr:ribosomal RNA-processing protein 7 homolog A [Spodoptera litura]